MTYIPFLLIIWSCALIFTSIAVWCYRSKKPVHFWSGTSVNPNLIQDTRAYNRANGRMWLTFSLLYWIAGLLSIWHINISGLLVGFGTLIGLPLLILCYSSIWKRYKK